MEQYDIPFKKLSTLPNQWYDAGKTVQVTSVLGKYYPKNISELAQIITGKDKERFVIKVYKSRKDGAPSGAIDEYVCDLRAKSLRGVGGDIAPAPTQNTGLEQFHLLLADSTAKIQEKAAWDLERMKLTQEITTWKDKYDLCKEKNTELIASCAKLESITEKMEQSAKDMEGKASFTDALKGIAGTVVPMLMGGGGGNPQLAGLNQAQQEPQDPMIGYNQILSDTFGNEAKRVDEILLLLAENPNIIGRTRGWLDTEKLKKNAQ